MREKGSPSIPPLMTRYLMVTDGKAEVRIAGTSFVIGTGEMIILPANKPHAVFAHERFRMILTMIRE